MSLGLKYESIDISVPKGESLELGALPASAVQINGWEQLLWITDKLGAGTRAGGQVEGDQRVAGAAAGTSADRGGCVEEFGGGAVAVWA
jgi:hypothetical protein